MDKITGQTLIDWGFKPGKHFGEMLKVANEWKTAGKDDDFIRGAVRVVEPKEPVLDPAMQMRTNSVPFGLFLEIEAEENSQAEEDQLSNARAVIRHMDALMRVPTIVAGAVMPDACPAGSAEGTIPVGGVAVSQAIHPGMHSADVCCSMAISVFKRDMDVSKVLDAAMKITHFGAGKSSRDLGENARILAPLADDFNANPFLRDLANIAVGQLGTQGDGNHFLYVGHLKSTGQLAVVTHHGSRNVGGQLYKRGMAVAKRHTAIVSPRTPEHNAWIDAESDDGRAYWAALQVVREWTRLNHFTIHNALQQAIGSKIVDSFWNEHNFVFQRDDGLFYHGKGATPAIGGPALIPLNMGQPILITQPHKYRPGGAQGFAPHGAGRNMSRTEHIRRLETEFGVDRRGLSDRDRQVILERETKGLDVRFYCGTPDVSELPSAYKNADQVRASIEKHSLIDIVDEVIPAGCIMAGEMPWNLARVK